VTEGPHPRLSVLPNDAMRARYCPRAIVAFWAWEAVLGAALAWPFASIVRSTYGSHPHGDLVLWEPGGLALLDLVVRRTPVLGALVAHGVIVLLFAAVLGLVPAAALLASLAFSTAEGKRPSLREALALAMDAALPSASVFAVAVVFDVSLGAAALAGATLADEGFSRAFGDVAADGIALSFIVLCAAAGAAAGVLQELARAAVVRFGVGARDGLRTALRALTITPTALLWSWGWRALASLVPLALGGLLAERLGGLGGGGLVALWVLHQLIVLVRVALRASWLARAMRAVDAVETDRRRTGVGTFIGTW
jgi:hypothetical protein